MKEMFDKFPVLSDRYLVRGPRMMRFLGRFTHHGVYPNKGGARVINNIIIRILLSQHKIWGIALHESKRPRDGMLANSLMCHYKRSFKIKDSNYEVKCQISFNNFEFDLV